MAMNCELERSDAPDSPVQGALGGSGVKTKGDMLVGAAEAGGRSLHGEMTRVEERV